MLRERFIATPFGVRRDYITADNDCCYSEYLPDSLPGVPPERGVSPVWRGIAFGALASCLLQGIAGALWIAHVVRV